MQVVQDFVAVSAGSPLSQEREKKDEGKDAKVMRQGELDRY